MRDIRGGKRSLRSAHGRACRPIAVLAVLLLAAVEVSGVLSLALGPSNFEREVRRGAARAEYAWLETTLFPPRLTPPIEAPPAESVLVKVVDLAKSGQSGAAARYFADDLFSTSRYGGTTLQAKILPAEVPQMVALIYSQLDVVRWRTESAGKETVLEVADVRTTQLRLSDLSSVGVIYQMRVVDGKITRVTTTFEPRAVEELAASDSELRERVGPPVAGFALALAALALPAVVGLREVGWRGPRTLVVLALAPLLAVVLVRSTLDLTRPADAQSSELAEILPGQVVYAYHVMLGDISDQIGLAPESAALQWVKAASHAESPDQLARASAGISKARARSGDDPALDAALCEQFQHGSPSVRDAVTRAGALCR